MPWSERDIDILKRLGKRNPTVRYCLKAAENGMEFNTAMTACIEVLVQHVDDLSRRLESSKNAVSKG